MTLPDSAPALPTADTSREALICPPAPIRPTTGRDALFWLGLGAIGCLVFALLYGSTFPEASIRFRVTRTEAAAVAAQHLAARGFDVDTWRQAVNFSWNDQAKSFLEKELPHDQAVAAMKSDVRLWNWSCRFFVPSQHVEHSVSVSPEGDVTGHSWTLPEDARGASLPRDSALVIARGFLEREGLDLAEWKLVDATTSAEKHRTDHAFTWEKIGFSAAGATWRRTVSVKGDAVGGFGEYLKIPEAWTRAEEERQAPRRVLSTVASSFDALLGATIVIAFIAVLRRRAGHFRFALAAGGVIALLRIVTTLNSYPLIWSGYSTTESLEAFLVDWFSQIPIGAIAALADGALLAYTAAAISRRAFPHHPPLFLATRRAFWVSRETFHSILAGYGLGFVHLGYVTLFYVLGRKLGVWCPTNIPTSETVTTALPGIYPVVNGFFPAFNEEFTYRLFAVALLSLWVAHVFLHRSIPAIDAVARAVKRPWLAVLAPGVLWAFLHVGYPQEPFYIRGVELTVIGVLYGVVFLRHGILCTFVAHYTVNAVLSSTLLLRAEHPWLLANGIAASLLMLVPALPGVWRLLRGGSLLSPEELRALEEPVAAAAAPSAEPVPESPWTYRPFTRRQALLLGLLAVTVFVPSLFKPEPDLPPIEVPTTLHEAGRIADQHLKERGLNPSAWRRSIRFAAGGGGWAPEYAYEIQGETGISILHASPIERASWTIRYCRPLLKEEYSVQVDRFGRVVGFDHELDEAAPGARLSETEAERLAEAALRDRGLDTSALRVVDHSSEERPARTDHSFTWENDSWTIGDGHIRHAMSVQGDEAGDYYAWFKVPESWERERSRRELKDSVIGAITGIISLALALFLVGFFFRGLMRRPGEGADQRRAAWRRAAWRRAAFFAAIPPLCLPFEWLNDAPSFWSWYSTSQPVTAFLAIKGMYYALAFGGIFVAGVIGFAAADGLMRRTVPGYPSLWQWLRGRIRVEGAPSEESASALLWRDALIGGVAAGAIGAWAALAARLAERALRPALFAWAPGSPPSARVIGGYASWSPLLDIPSLVPSTLLILAVVAVLAAFWNQEKRRARFWIALAATMFVLAAVREADTAAGVLARLIIEAATLIFVIGAVLVIFRRVLRDHAGAYVMTILLVYLAAKSREFLEIPDATMRFYGGVHAALGLLIVAFAAWRARGAWRRRSIDSE